MKLPGLQELPTQRDVIDAFGGFDHRLRTAENTFLEMENGTGDFYPAFGPRRARGRRAIAAGAGVPQGVLSGDTLTYVAGNRLYVDDEPVLRLQSGGPRDLIAMGAYIIVLPDKVWYNTAKKESGAIEASFSAQKGVTAALCDQDGGDYGEPTVSDTAPSSPSNGDLWIDTSVTPNAMKQFSATTGLWNGVATVYVRLSADGIGSGFSDGDAVVFDGLSQFDDYFKDYEGKSVLLQKVQTDSIVIVGLLQEAGESAQPLTITRAMPTMDHVFECGNRLWGCRYGENDAGEFVNEIYCSALGDFKNWKRYAGISTDSYAVSVGSDGPFTGGIAYQGVPHFFKADVLHRVYGAYPETYQVQTLNCRGVQAGSARSLAVLNERLFYKGASCVCMFDGSYPDDISAVFGELHFDRAVGGADADKYYISMRGTDGGYNLFVYDQKYNTWYREDKTCASAFATAEGRLYFIDDARMAILSVTAADGDTQVYPAESWRVITNDLGLSLTTGRRTSRTTGKYVSRVTIRAGLAQDSTLRVYIQYDGWGDWIPAAVIEGSRMHSVSLPIRPRRCEYFRLKIEGEGDVKLFSIIKNVQMGSDLP